MIYVKKNLRVLPDDTDAFGRLNWLACVRYCEEGEAGLMEMLDFSVMSFYRAQKTSFPRRSYRLKVHSLGTGTQEGTHINPNKE
jgi:acyl-CoA thioesterase FadM